MSIRSTFNNIIGAVIEKEDSLSGIDDISLIFSVIESHNVNIQSNITDYWLEDHTAIQESIGLQPIQITLSGLVGEIEHINGSSWGNTLIDKLNQLSKEKLGFTLTDKLSSISSLVPQMDNYTQLAKNALQTVEGVYKNIKGKINKIFGNKTELKQTQRAKWLMDVWQTKTALKVTTPFGTFHNMYILNAPMVQEQTNTVSKISVTLKQLRFAKEVVTEGNAIIRSEINKVCGSEVVENGVMKTEEMSLSDYISDFVGANPIEGLSL